MQIQVGYELVFRCPQPTPMIVTLSVHYSRVSDLIKADHLVLAPSVPVTAYRDSFGNWCSRIVAPSGQIRLSSDAVVSDTGNPDVVAPWLEQRPVEASPEETLLFLLGSRYCETDLLSETAWQLFGAAADWLEAGPGHLRFRASTHSVRLRPFEPDEVRFSSFSGSQGRVSRLCPSRQSRLPLYEYSGAYCTGYLGDIGDASSRIAHGLCGLVRGLSRRRLVHLRSCNNTPRIGAS